MSAACSWRSKKSTLRPMSSSAGGVAQRLGAAPRRARGSRRLQQRVAPARARARGADSRPRPRSARPGPHRRGAHVRGRRQRSCASRRAARPSRTPWPETSTSARLQRPPSASRWPRAPPTMESPRSSFRPGIAVALACSCARPTSAATLVQAPPRQHVAVQARDRVAAARAGRSWPGCARCRPCPPASRPRAAAGTPRVFAAASRTCALQLAHLARRRAGRSPGRRRQRRSEPSGRLQAVTSARCRKRETCMLPPPMSKSSAVLDRQPAHGAQEAVARLLARRR